MGLAKIEGDEIVIRLPIANLPNCVELACDNEYGYEQHNLKMDKSGEFIKEFLNSLNEESENGDTVLHKAIDEAIINAIEGGAFGIEEIS